VNINEGDVFTIGEAGSVHHYKSEYHIKDDSTDWLSIYSHNADNHSEWDATDPIYLMVDSAKVSDYFWIPDEIDHDHGDIGTWSGGGIDIRFSTGAVIKYCETAYNYICPTRPVGIDAYGINADQDSEKVMIYYNVSHHNEGAGIELHDTGKTTPTEVYHNLMYNNTVKFRTAGGLFINMDARGGKAIILNNIMVGDTLLALKASSVTEANITLDHNLYCMAAGDNYNPLDVIIDWEGIEYIADGVADDFEDFKTWSDNEGHAYEEFGIAEDPLIESLEESDYRLHKDSPVIDQGFDLSATIIPYLDYYLNTVPVDGDGANGAEVDIGHYEYSLGWKWGGDSDIVKHHNDGWTEGEWGAEKTGEITGNAETGSIKMNNSQYFLSRVINLGGAAPKHLVITYNELGTSGTMCWRGAATIFEAIDSSPAWEEYTAGVNIAWRYGQIGIVNGPDCSTLP